MPPLRDIVVGFSFCVLSTVFIYLPIYCSYSLEPVGYGRYRKGINNNGSSQTDVLKQTRKPDERNPPPGRRHPRSVVPKEAVGRGMHPLRSIAVGVVCLCGPGRAPGFSPWSSPIPPPLSHSIEVRRNFLTPLHSPPPPRPLSPRWSRCDVHQVAGRVCPIQ